MGESADLVAEKKNFLTGTTLLLSFFPFLFEKDAKDELAAYVEDAVLLLDRDSYQQVLHALSLCATAQKCLPQDFVRCIFPCR